MLAEVLFCRTLVAQSGHGGITWPDEYHSCVADGPSKLSVLTEIAVSGMDGVRVYRQSGADKEFSI